MTYQDIDCKLADDDMKVSKHGAVLTTQTACCDIYCYDSNCAFVGHIKKIKHNKQKVTIGWHTEGNETL
jgi:hypothetical protein